MQGYFKNNTHEKVIFDVFFRSNPEGAAYSITAGLAQVIEYVNGLHFTADDIAYLRSTNLFQEDFLDYLKDFHFTGDIYAIPEGTIVFPK